MTLTPFRVRSAARALQFVQERGVVLASAKGPVPRLIDFIADQEIEGNWWSHPHGSAIYNVLAEVTDSDQVLVCRLVNRKVTLVHRRLWPALVRLAERYAPEQIAKVEERHTASGRHRTDEIPFPAWVPPEVARMAAALSEDDALMLLGACLSDSVLGQPGRAGSAQPTR